jgi:general secretion pathway protein J
MTPPKRLRRLPPGGNASGRAKPDPRRSLGKTARGLACESRERRSRHDAVARSQSGFTLVEVLVALVLMALLSGMAWRGLDGISRTRDASQARVELSLRLNTVLAQWEQDLQSLYDTPIVPTLSFDGATLRLVRRQPEGLQVVAWSLREQRWLRWAGPIVTQPAALQESWLVSQQLLGNEAAQLRMHEGLAGWQVYFYRGNAWSNAQSSAGAAPPPAVPGAPPTATRTPLPTGVRAVLNFAGGGLAGNLTRDILLGPQSP